MAQKQPLFFDSQLAGSVNADESYEEIGLEITDLIAPLKESTFYMTVSGNSMVKSGIYKNDILVIDRSLTPKSGNTVVAFLNNKFVVRKLLFNKYKQEFVDSFGNKENLREEVAEIWGVVTYSIHKLM